MSTRSTTVLKPAASHCACRSVAICALAGVTIIVISVPTASFSSRMVRAASGSCSTTPTPGSWKSSAEDSVLLAVSARPSVMAFVTASRSIAIAAALRMSGFSKGARAWLGRMV